MKQLLSFLMILTAFLGYSQHSILMVKTLRDGRLMVPKNGMSLRAFLFVKVALMLNMDT
jgi:hypothetical protein